LFVPLARGLEFFGGVVEAADFVHRIGVAAGCGLLVPVLRGGEIWRVDLVLVKPAKIVHRGYMAEFGGLAEPFARGVEFRRIGLLRELAERVHRRGVARRRGLPILHLARHAGPPCRRFDLCVSPRSTSMTMRARR